MSRPSVNELQNSELYELMAAMPVHETIQYLQSELGMNKGQNDSAKSSKLKIVYGVFLGILGVIGGYAIGKSFGNADNPFFLIKSLGLAFLLFFVVLLPIHEFIHGVAFKYYGAKKVGYGFSMKAAMVYAYAQDFPINMRELKVIAVLPFMLITFSLLMFMLFLPQYFFAITSILLIHSLACVGDFMLIKYANKYNNEGIFTYDDLEIEKKSYFYRTI